MISQASELFKILQKKNDDRYLGKGVKTTCRTSAFQICESSANRHKKTRQSRVY